MKRQTQIDKAIARLEDQKRVLDLAIAHLKEQQKEPKLRMAKARLVPATEKSAV